MRKISYLDGLRGFAALQVVLVHYLSVFLPAQQCSRFWFCWQQGLREHFLFFPVDGMMAVSLFFILSGFVLTKSFAQTREKLVRNILKRWVRLQIPVFFALALAFALFLFLGNAHHEAIRLNDSANYAWQFWTIPPTFESFFREAFWASLLSGYENISIFAGFGGDFFSGSQTLNPVFWSLNIEFWGSVLIIVLAYLRPNIMAHHLAILLCILFFPMHNLILFVVGHILACATDGEEKELSFPIRLTRNLGGAVLVLLGILIGTWRENAIPENLFSAINGITFFPAQSPYHYAGMIAAAFVFLGVFMSPWFHALFNLAPFQKLGRISFSLFLLHFPILLTVTAFLQVQFHRFLGHGAGAFLSAILGLIITFKIAALFTKWIDTPAIRLSRFIGGQEAQATPQEPPIAQPSFEPLRRKPLMTANEQEFFGRLARALPDYHVFPQVAFNALLDAQKGLCWRDRLQIRNHFDRKIADYVVCSRDTFEVIAVVELDDKTHKAEKDEKRDVMLTGAGYRVKRFQSREKPSCEELAQCFGFSAAP